MTEPERELTEAQRILDGSKCSRCGEYGTASINYEPGVCWIECALCNRSVSLPDFNPTAALKQWAETD
jgi:Zn ribbon nucleic-acid-binding protein